MEDYKGIYYNESKEEKYFEGGAHFKYIDLFKALKTLGGIVPQRNYENPSILNNFIDTNNEENEYYKKKEKEKKQKPKTRNINNMNFINNPNTKITFNENKIHKKSNLKINNFNYIKQKTSEKNINNKFYEKNKALIHIHPNSQRYHMNYNLSKTVLIKSLNNNNSIIRKMLSNNYYEPNQTNNIFNYIKYAHFKNKSDAFLKNNDKDKKNNFDILNNIKVKKKIAYMEMKAPNNLQNSMKINSINRLNNNETNSNRNKNFFTKKNNCLIVYSKSKINLYKSRLNTQFNNLGKYVKKSRNIANQNYFSYIKSLDYNNNQIFKGNFSINNYFNKNEINNNSSSLPLNNKTINYKSIDNLCELNNKEKYDNDKILNVNKNGQSALKRYIKKKISLYYDFNKKKLGNGKKIIPRNNNYLDPKFNEQNIKYKNSSEIDSINTNINTFSNKI